MRFEARPVCSRPRFSGPPYDLVLVKLNSERKWSSRGDMHHVDVSRSGYHAAAYYEEPSKCRPSC